ncbi:MAG: tRNA (guanosine(37)-N1)-methyltransferase TrmD [Clostridiales bacterium]|nr:tRNA (guanosine(37)-N1)-methyltransferase TrmD [Clostridiales bacterium]
MRIDVLTLFPEMFEGVFHTSILGRAEAKGILSFHTHDIRAYSENKHHNTDDYAFGGGAGMVMMAQPVFDCMEAVLAGGSARRILMTPRGRTLTPEYAMELSKEERLVILAGHYEGLDERISELIDDEISIGDYVLTGGELPAMVLVDCLSRFIPGVLGCSESAEDESFSNDGLLEYPQYTRPADFRGRLVPEVLLNGNHAEINKWRRQQSLLKTLEMRPDLLEKAELSKQDTEFLRGFGYEKR